MVLRPTLSVLTALCLAACGVEGPGSGDDPVAGRLLAAADRAAESNGGKARHVEAVQTTRARAADLDGHSHRDQSELVWVVQVSGDDYVCDVCSAPFGAQAPAGRYITLMLRASNYEGTDSGLGPQRMDLASLGDVQVLRDGR